MSARYDLLHAAHFDDRALRVLNARKCLSLVLRHFAATSLVDFGCGIGHWLVAAKELGVKRVLGIEGDWLKTAQVLAEPSEIFYADLSTTKLSYDRRFDIALSIEVGEHLPDTASNLLCDSLVDAANVVVFSAAIIGQTGVNHINEQKPRYWVDKFWQRGFVPLELIRPAISNEPKMYSWLRQNLVVYMNYDILHTRSDLSHFALPLTHFYVRYRPM